MVQECILTFVLLGSPKFVPGRGHREQREAGLPVSNGDAVQQVADLGFWLDRLATAPRELLLPVDRPHPAEPTPPLARRTRELALVDRLNEDSQATLMAAFA